MKTKLLILLMFICSLGYAQQNVSTKQFSNIAALRLQAGTDKIIVRVMGQITETDKNGGDYRWDATSTATDDGILVIKVANVATGRWMKMMNDNTIKGSATLSGLVLQTAYPISFGQTLPNIPAIIIVQAYSANAAVPSWVSNVTTTGFTVNFASVPILGTNNILINYIIIKN